MKKITSLIVLMAASFLVKAQTSVPIHQSSNMSNLEMVHIGVLVSVLIAIMYFISAIVKRFLDYRLKNKIIEKGVSETIATAIIQTDSSTDKNNNIKWFAILMAISIGSAIIYITLPLGIHSVAIMAFCIAISFLGYYFFLKNSAE